MLTFNATPARLRLLADAIEADEVLRDEVRLQVTGAATYVIVHEEGI